MAFQPSRWRAHGVQDPARILVTGLVDQVGDVAHDGGSHVVDVYVGYLRRKIDLPFARNDVETVRGVGYPLRLSAD